MGTFSITINISPKDLQILKSEGYSLYGFKSVICSANGSPTVWFNIPVEKLLEKTIITWQEEFHAYNSISTIAPQVKIEPKNITPTYLGQLIKIEKGSGYVLSGKGGDDGAISFINADYESFTIGVKQMVNGVSNILCAFPILGTGYSRIITPINKIALIFSTERIEVGTVLTKAISAGSFINLTGANTRVVDYFTNEGWKANGEVWLKNFDAFTDLKKLLIENSNSEEKAGGEKV